MIAEVLTPHIPRMLLFCIGCFHVSAAAGTLIFLGKIFMTFMLLLVHFQFLSKILFLLQNFKILVPH